MPSRSRRIFILSGKGLCEKSQEERLSEYSCDCGRSGDVQRHGHGDPVEIQIRSFAMDYWAELDTQMCYKKDAGQIANVERETRGYSDVIAKVDNKMLELRQQIEMM